MKATVKEKETTSGKQTANESKLKQVTLAQAEDMHKVWDINDVRAKAIHVRIAEMIALDCQPYSVVDDIGFRALIHALEPRYNIPSRRYFSETMIPSIVDRMACVIRDKLKVVKYVSFTTDVWSSNVSSVSLIAHWVSDDFQ